MHEMKHPLKIYYLALYGINEVIVLLLLNP